MHQVLTIIKNYKMVKPGEKVLVAVSGGPDSMALLHILNELKERLQFELHIFHLNHLFRGNEASEDAQLVENTANIMGIPSTIIEYDVESYCKKYNKSKQEGAREVRYKYFSRIAADVGAARVALGHHGDDQVETIVLNFLRGTGLTGLKGFLPVRDNFYIRPLFQLRRSDIIRYCEESNVSYRNDSSNMETFYKRNQIRHNLIPVLEQYNPSFAEAIIRTSNVLRTEDSFLEAETEKFFAKSVSVVGVGKYNININTFSKQHIALQRRLLRKIWSILAGSTSIPGFGQLETVLNLVKEGKGSWEHHLPGNVRVIRSYQLLQFKNENGQSYETPAYCYKLKVPGVLFIPETGFTIHSCLVSKTQVSDPNTLPPNEVLLDFNKLKGELYVRRRMPGDYFTPLGMNNSKVKLKKFFIDLKIPRNKRDLIPIIVCGDEIIWVAGLRPGEKFKVTKESEQLLHLALKNNNINGFMNDESF